MTSKKNSDQSRIFQLQRGDLCALEYFMDRYHNRLLAYARTLTPDKALAEDLVQEVFIALWRRKSSLIITRSLEAYLFQSVKHRFLNTLKKKKNMQELHQKFAEHLNQIQNENDETQVQHYLKIVEQEIRALPPRCQKIFILNKKEGLTHTEIADYLHISTKAVEAQITKAYKQLRKRLQDNGLMDNNLILLLLWQVKLQKKRRVRLANMIPITKRLN